MITSLLVAHACLCTALVSGDPGAPAWPRLPATDGGSYSLDDFRGCRVLVLVFTGNECPIAADYHERLNELHDRLEGEGVRFVAINAVEGPAESLEAMKAMRPGPRFPYLEDEDLELARRLGAKVTPHAFVLDGGSLEVLYSGAIDDSPGDPEGVTHRYLEDGIRAVLEGGAPAVRSRVPKGCVIAYRSHRSDGR